MADLETLTRAAPGRPETDKPARIQVTMPVALVERIELCAFEDGLTRNEWIRYKLLNACMESEAHMTRFRKNWID